MMEEAVIKYYEKEFNKNIEKYLNKTKILNFKNETGNNMIYPVKTGDNLKLWYNRKTTPIKSEYEFGNLDSYTVYNKNINVANSIKSYIQFEINYKNFDESETYFRKKDNETYLFFSIPLYKRFYEILKENKILITKQGNKYVFTIEFEKSVETLNKIVTVLYDIENNKYKLHTKKEKPKISKKDNTNHERFELKERKTDKILNKREKRKNIKFQIKDNTVINYEIKDV